MVEKRTPNLIELKKFEVGHYVKINDKYYRIKDIEPFVAIKDYGVVQPMQKSQEIRDSSLEPKEGFYRWVAIPLTNVRIRFKIPSSVDRYILEGMTDSGYLDIMDLDGAEPVYAFITFPNQTVTFVFENPNNVSVNAIVKFYGFKYEVEEVKDPDALDYVRKLEKEGKLPIFKFE